MVRPASNLMTVERELHAPVASAQLVSFDFLEPIENLVREQDSYRIDLCLTPRPGNARARFVDRWSEQRFERIGNLFLLPPGEPMLAVSDGCCQQASLICQLHPEPMREWFDGELQWTDRGLSASLDVRDRNIRSLLLRLAEEAKHPGFASEMLVELISAQLAIELARYCTVNNERADSRGLASWRLQRIDDRLQVVGPPPTLAELATLCQLSVRQLTRGFRMSRGCSIGDHVARNRVEQARQLLASEQSVKIAAYTLGFASPSSFSFAFRRATGETPSEFRQRQRRMH